MIGYLFDYDYIKYHYKLMEIDSSRQKELGANSEAIR